METLKKLTKRASKKLLSVLLAVVMIMSSMSVCFGTTTFAAGGNATDAQWNALANALANDTIKSASFTGSTNNKTVDDPDGKVIAAVEAYFAVVNAIANKAPACGNPSNDTSVTGSTEGNRTINQVNTTIKNEIASRLGNTKYVEYNVDAFLTGLLAGANVSAGTGSQLGGRDKTNDSSAPDTNLSTISDIKITVTMASAVTGYTLDTLPDNVVTSKSFTVKHTNTNYDYSYKKETVSEGSGCNKKDVDYFTEYYNYFYNISGVSSTDGASVSTQTIKDSAAVLSANAGYFSKDLDALVAVFDATTLGTVKTAVTNAKANVVKDFGATVYSHFFSAYNVEALTTNIDKAVKIITAANLAIDLDALVDAGYDSIITDKGALETLANKVKTLADKYDAYATDVKGYVESHEYEGEMFVRADVTDFYNAILKEIELIELRALKAAIDAEILGFLVFDEDNVADKTYGSEILNYAKGTVDGWIGALNTYADANVAEVWGEEDIDTILADLSTELNHLIKVNGYVDNFANKYADYLAVIYGKIVVDRGSEEFINELKGVDSWYSGLNSLLATIETALGEELANKIYKDLDKEMKDYIDSHYNILYARIDDQIILAYDLYNELIADTEVTVLNVNTYTAFEKAFGHIETDVYDFLYAASNFDMPQETIDKYNAIKKLGLDDYHNFVTSGGFDRFEQTEISDIVRAEEETDNHDAHIGDYTVTDEKVEKIITLIDELLADDDIKAILGKLINKDKVTGEPTGEPFDLAALINGLLEGIYTDDLINTIVQYVYPLVAKEFAKVWAGIDPHVITQTTVLENIPADVDTYLNLYDVETAIAGVGIYLAPKTLAAHLKSVPEYAGYTDVISVLEAGTTVTKYDFKDKANEEDDVYTDAWADANLFTNVLDENGESVLNDDGTNKTKLNLKWGVTDRESFIDAACAALSGLEPLLFALLSNQHFVNPNTSSKPDDVRGCKIGTSVEGKSTVSVYGIKLPLTLDPITLMFDITGNDGYDNVLAPIFEALGCENIPHGEELTTTRKILEDGLFGMLDQVIANVAEAPLDFILSALPNLTYALSVNRIKPLLDMLEIEIYYEADAYYSAHIYVDLWLIKIDENVTGAMQGAMKAEEDKDGDGVKEPAPVKINIGEMINLDDMGLDLSFDGIWGMVTGALGENVTLPKLDAGYVATLGALTWKDTNRSRWTYTSLEAGKAAYIEANKADVLIYLLRYLLNTLGENPDLLASFGLELSDDVKSIIAGVTANPDKTIAAIVELFNQTSYDSLKDYVWYVSELKEDTVVGMTPAIEQYLAYDNNWTKETATYLVENVNNIISTIAGESFNLSDTLAGLIDGLFTNKNITALAKALSGIDLSAIDTGDLALDINALVNKFAGLDLSGFAAYADLADDATWGFEDGDKAGFVAALVEVLAPLDPVINFILAGENLTLLDDVNIIGYNGYDSAIVPLLEALGATPAVLADGENVLEAVLNALVARVDAIIADPIDEILNLIPSLLYFIKSDGITTAVRNLLQPVYVILETIDPIYALNLNQLIGGFTKDLGFSINLDDLSFEAIFNILDAVVALDLSELKDIIDDVCEVITPVTYKSASSLIGENGKKGAYGKYFDAADLLTVLVSFALSWIQEGNNANDVVALIAGDDAAKAAEIQKYITGAITVIGGIEPEYQSIDWDYNFPADYEDSIFESGLTIQPTINTITYPTNWTEDAAEYVGENLDEIANEIIGLVDENYATVADFIADKVTIYSSENVDAIVAGVAGLLADIDEVLVNTIGAVLGADIATLKAYKAPADIDTAEEFAAALTEVLGTIQPVLDWLLFGGEYNFFSKSGTNLVTIKGAEGYAYGLAPILEALGVDAPAKDVATVKNVLEAVFARVDAVLADPVNEVFDLLPNIVYFLNANGIAVSVQNLLAGVTGLMAAVKENFGVEIDLIAIINNLVNGMLEEKDVTLDVANLDLESIFKLAQKLTGLDLAPIANILVDLCVGNIVVYTSASGEYGFKMQYNDDFARYDMITIVVAGLLQIIKNDANAEVIKGMLGEKVYNAILNVISLNTNVPVQEFDWQLTDKVGETFSAIETSKEFQGDVYGKIYTEEHAKYIADNFGGFVDNIIYLLGIDVNGDGKSETGLVDLINGLVDGSVYNSNLVISIRNALAGLAGTLETSIPAGAHILEILKLADIADLKSIASVEVPEFTEDRDAFVAALCDVLEPIYPVLKWLLADTDLTFFIDEEKTTLITLPGAEGYAYGLIPVLEALDCKDIVTPDDYYATIENGEDDVIITSIIDSLLNRVDSIIANPADEILAILPNIIYFINSNGVDTVVKNTLNAVYTLLNAIEPIAKIDLYELIGIDFKTINFNWLVNKLLEVLGNAGYSFTIEDIDAIAELTVGKLESYTSVNGEAAYRMVYAPNGGIEGGKTEMVTVIERLVITFLADPANQEAAVKFLKEKLNMNSTAEQYVRSTIKLIAECITDISIGMETALLSIYYLFYGVDTGAGEAAGGLNDLNNAWKDAINDLKAENSAAGELIEDILSWDIFEDVIDTETGVAPNGLIRFFQKIAEWFQGIINFFKNLFN